ncbi:MAG: HypC/HybG/HupF family hydrogenase formation chaperone, partial [Dechloromonas sp.]|nr:HypC/HybG/HupF family hydrogenase formation chaperone [Dechloromonas sp.]
PAQVIEFGEHFARCSSRNGELRVDLSLVGMQPPGTWLLIFLDAAREIIPAERAAAVDAALDALAAAESGATDFSAFFADLDREPQLPDFLRTQQS